MADGNTPPVATGGDSGTNWTLIGGLALLLVGGGVAAYFVFFNKPSDKKADEKSGDKKTAAETEKKSSETPATEAPATTTTETKTSPVRTDFDGEYNYQKKSGVWWTAKKASPDKWVSLGDPKWQAAVDKLNARYPND